MGDDLTNACVVITGGANGIGRAAADAFAREGARIAIWDRRVEAAERAAVEIREATNSSVVALGMDQRDPGQVAAALEATIDHFGRIDVLVANAGVGTMRPFLELEAKDWNLAIDVNLTGSFHVCHAVARHMVERGGGGSIVVNVSISATHNTDTLSHYCASKAGLGMLVRCMASELGEHRIRVNGVSPGFIRTEMTSGLLAHERTATMAVSTTPLGRVGTPEEVAGVMTFLASEAAAFIDGQTILVCGGQSIPSIPAYDRVDDEDRAATVRGGSAPS